MSALKANSLNKDLEKCIEPSKKILHSSLNFDLEASTEISKGTICKFFHVSWIFFAEKSELVNKRKRVWSSRIQWTNNLILGKKKILFWLVKQDSDCFHCVHFIFRFLMNKLVWMSWAPSGNLRYFLLRYSQLTLINVQVKTIVFFYVLFLGFKFS